LISLLTKGRSMSESNELATIFPAVFSFQDVPVRVMDRLGDTWFILANVCRAIGIRNAPMAASRLGDDERSSVSLTDGTSPAGGNPNVTVISEAGL
jgi:anti-repressor protein